MLIKKRHTLSSKDLKELLEEAKKICPALVESIAKKKEMELVELEGGERIYFQEGKPILIWHDGKVMPSLAMPQPLLECIPKVTVDMGAVPFVVKGADIMAPGIRSVSEEAKLGEVVLVVDEKYSKGLAVGILIMSREEILHVRKGKAVKNIHHVGDEIWNSAKSIL